jgi:uncharacterized protein
MRCSNILLSVLVANGSIAVALTPVPPEESAARRAAPLVQAMPHVRAVEWEELLPPAQRDHFSMTPPPPIHDYLGEGGPGATQSGSAEVNRKLDGARVRIPGFVVPLEVTRDGKVTEFLLVPYFGACIHVPPPPPNQMVHVKTQRSLTLDSLEDAFWITGTIHVETGRSHFGASAYAMQADKIEVYKY